MHTSLQLAATLATLPVVSCHRSHIGVALTAAPAQRIASLRYWDFTWAFATRKCLEATWEINKRAHATNCGNLGAVGCCCCRFRFDSNFDSQQFRNAAPQLGI
ncbi:hypothetical protein ACLKA6_004833 [Drosophila palustris]